ncbi:MAG: hypothetical protein EOM64_10335 [Erysipelotrichia bacterium]|nr:hypothetical protein [Erysipelotrichia bacterium]
MELIVMDKDFTELGTIELFSSLQWNRKYYECGDYELHCSTDYFELLDSGTYLFRSGYELALIDSVDLSRSSTNESTTKVTGKFIESILNDRVCPGTKTYTGTHEAIARQCIDEYFISPTDTDRKFNYLSLGADGGYGTDTTLELKNDEIGDSVYTLLEEQELSQQIDYDYQTNTLKYQVWKGTDRTDDQDANTWAVFSDEFENITDTEYSKNISDYKNVAYVIGKNNVVCEVDQSNGERRREMTVTSTESDTAVLKSKGEQALTKYKTIEVFNGKIINSDNLVYRTGWDLGDLVTVINKQVNKILNIRITEIKEVFEDGEMKITPKFGSDYLSISNFIKREAGK